MIWLGLPGYFRLMFPLALLFEVDAKLVFFIPMLYSWPMVSHPLRASPDFTSLQWAYYMLLGRGPWLRSHNLHNITLFYFFVSSPFYIQFIGNWLARVTSLLSKYLYGDTHTAGDEKQLLFSNCYYSLFLDPLTQHPSIVHPLSVLFFLFR